MLKRKKNIRLNIQIYEIVRRMAQSEKRTVPKLLDELIKEGLEQQKDTIYKLNSLMFFYAVKTIPNKNASQQILLYEDVEIAERINELERYNGISGTNIRRSLILDAMLKRNIEL